MAGDVTRSASPLSCPVARTPRLYPSRHPAARLTRTSNKANDFKNNESVAVNFWWPSTDVQVRLEGTISKCSENFSDEHFNSREIGKNAAAIASDQSKPIESYEILKAKFEQVKEAISTGEIQHNRPPDWGGYQIKIAFFEFWEANKERLNYRECYKLENDDWRRYFLQS